MSGRAASGQEGARLAERFDWLADALARQSVASMMLMARWRAERSDFVRFNHGRVRQPGTVERQAVELKAIEGRRTAKMSLTLSGEPGQDEARLADALQRLRAALAHSSDDPFLIVEESGARSRVVQPARLASPSEVIDAVATAAADCDLVGFYMGGPCAIGLASTSGHRHYHESASWSLDYSLYTGRDDLRDKAIKSQVAGQGWDAGAVNASIAEARARLALLAMPARRLDQGEYRAWLSARSVADLIDTMAWGGFSARDQLTGQSPLQRLREGRCRFDSRFSIAEDLAMARAPRFQADGFAKPERIELIRDGGFAGWLASPRTAREFGIESNAAEESEGPVALSVQAGSLVSSEALQRLDTGLEISNLWYLNYSDRNACRVTGMTRFATLWVERGEPVAPVEVMRFDEVLFDLLGDRLIDLGTDPVWLPDTDSYDWRGFGGRRVPGALVEGMRFTL